MTVALPRAKMRVPDFFDWWDRQPDGERFELVDGVVVLMGRDRAEHNLAKMRATNALNVTISKANLDCTAFVDGIGVSPNDQNYRLPDAVVNCGPVDPDATILPNPVIALEVVSPRSEDRDAHEKLYDYFAIPSLRHYVIVFLRRQFIVHHRRDDAGEIHTSFVTSGAIEFSPPGMSIDVIDLLGTGAV